MKMVHFSSIASAICGLVLFTGGCAQTTPPKPEEQPAISEDEPSPAPRKERGPASKAEKVVTVTGAIASLHKSRDGKIDGLRLDSGIEVRFPASAGQKLAGIISSGNRVAIEGWTQSGESEIHAATIKHETSGQAIDVDRPPPGIQGAPGGERRQDGRDDETDAGGRLSRPEEDPPGSHARPQSKERRPPKRDQAQRYSIEQATSDQAQLHTIAFDGLAFLTGDFGSDTFLPPGKVSDYFGFQYLRDIDANEGGHNTSFLTRIAHNMLAVLNDDHKAQLVALARQQESDIRRFAEMRLPLIKAFRRNLEGKVPAGSKGLDQGAVVKYSADLYELDGRLAFGRAKVMGGILRGLSDPQKAALAKLKFGDSRTWPDLPEQLDRKSLSHTAHVAVMTYASDLFAWYAGSLEADAYFCPERHGMYFGGFGMKTAPAMGKKNYSISTRLTGDSGQAFLAALTDAQRKLITDLIDLQRQDLVEIVKTRRTIAAELRRFQKGESADQDKVRSLSKQYGELDGELSYFYATAFAKVARTLSAQQKEQLARMRTSNPSDPKGPFLYSDPIEMPKIANIDFLFGVR